MYINIVKTPRHILKNFLWHSDFHLYCMENIQNLYLNSQTLQWLTLLHTNCS